MRCACPECGTYMIQSEGIELGCVCPNCLTRCKACLGTDTVIPRERLRDALSMPGNGPFTGFVRPGEVPEDDLDRFRPD